ncbi:MAG: site-specific DNA-methyltransferase [PVC group bacterium]|nr:site-specific DNA-methyltransferase [PVC group bacterium]
MLNKIINSDCLVVLKNIDDNSIDLILSDPPYGLTNLKPLDLIKNEELKGKGFMNREWDNIPSTAIFAECYRVLKDGAFMFLQFTPRQDAVTVLNYRLLQAGFNINFTPMFWCYGQGFPKAYNIAKGIEGKLLHGSANTTEWSKLDGEKANKGLGYSRIAKEQGAKPTDYSKDGKQYTTKVNYTTPEAKQFEGAYSYSPKPAVELIVVAMKPLSEKSFPVQALKNGRGCVWFDDCRIPTDEIRKTKNAVIDNKIPAKCMGIMGMGKSESEKTRYKVEYKNGRFPANILVEDDVLNDGEIRSSGARNKDYKNLHNTELSKMYSATFTSRCDSDSGSFSRYFSLDFWFNKRLKELPERVQKTFPFLIVAKPSKAEKNKGCEELKEQYTPNSLSGGTTKRLDGNKVSMNKNNHPTTKPLKLFFYLVTLGSREGDVVLDPFCGSGTTLLACKTLNRKYIGIEKEKEYYEIAKARLNSIEPSLFNK